MPEYCVNRQAQNNGDHEVHRLDTCTRLPLPHNRLALGKHSSCHTAVLEAKRHYSTANGCAWCSPECNTG